ncbi:MAG: methyltransferase domain-containing protein [Anaerolineae bacterium]|jgi:SAM-dependent methyltransferase|nr:methyltransferase domain-containing protein [Anaerolineae bacterium]
MPNSDDKLSNIKDYFSKKLSSFGTTSKGVDWNSLEAHEARFTQLTKILPADRSFTVLDYGCGYGELINYLDKHQYPYQAYFGYDILDEMIEAARVNFADRANCRFASRLDDIPAVEYATACGVFNMKLDADYESWTDFVIQSLTEMNDHASLGFSVNFLTKYSDADKMRPDLYYADPCFLFDFAKTHFSRNVALLHDYNLFDFTLLVRK